MQDFADNADAEIGQNWRRLGAIWKLLPRLEPHSQPLSLHCSDRMYHVSTDRFAPATGQDYQTASKQLRQISHTSTGPNGVRLIALVRVLPFLRLKEDQARLKTSLITSKRQHLHVIQNGCAACWSSAIVFCNTPPRAAKPLCARISGSLPSNSKSDNTAQQGTSLCLMTPISSTRISLSRDPLSTKQCQNDGLGSWKLWRSRPATWESKSRAEM